MPHASSSHSDHPAQEKSCRACGEKIAAQAKLCHVCSTPQRGPLWLYFWKDTATAIVAILALVPWVGGFLAFVWPVLRTPQPELTPIVYTCEGSIVSLGVVNSGKAFGFIKALSVRDDGTSNFPLLNPQQDASGTRPPLGDKSAVAAGSIRQLTLMATTSNQQAEQPIPAAAKRCQWTLHLTYLNTRREEKTADAPCVCDKGK